MKIKQISIDLCQEVNTQTATFPFKFFQPKVRPMARKIRLPKSTMMKQEKTKKKVRTKSEHTFIFYCN
jgi:hypothetical protein